MYGRFTYIYLIFMGSMQVNIPYMDFFLGKKTLQTLQTSAKKKAFFPWLQDVDEDVLLNSLQESIA